MKVNYDRVGVDATTRGRFLVGMMNPATFGGQLIVEEAVVEEVGGNASEFNVRVGGAVVVHTQSVASGETPESFSPTRHVRRTASSPEAVEIEPTNQESASETLNVGVVFTTPSKSGYPTAL